MCHNNLSPQLFEKRITEFGLAYNLLNKYSNGHRL